MNEPPTCIIREFQYPNDFPIVRELWSTAGPGIHLGRSDEPSEIIKKIKRDPELFLVAEIDGKIVGSVLGGYDGRRGLVYHLAVSSAHQRQGIAKILMSELEERMRKLGCIRSYLLVTKENLLAMRFYEQLGWERMDLHILGKNLS